MSLSIRKSDIDFSIFIGQKVIDILPVGKELFRIKFDNGSLNVECSWRFRDSQNILLGIGEIKEDHFISILKNHILNQPISNICHFEPIEDLSIEFNNQFCIDLFSDSSTFEQYQLYQGEILFIIGK